MILYDDFLCECCTVLYGYSIVSVQQSPHHDERKFGMTNKLILIT